MTPGQVHELRERVHGTARAMWEHGLVVASNGNASARAEGEDAIAVTPASIPYAVLTIDDIVLVGRDGVTRDGRHSPSSELPMHLAIYRARPDVSAVIHTHSPYVSVLSVLRRPLPPVIDEMAAYYGGTVRVAAYAFTGTERLAENAVEALGDRGAVILANHGNVCVGKDLDEALQVALSMELAARVYVEALRIGNPIHLPEDSVRRGREIYERRHPALARQSGSSSSSSTRRESSPSFRRTGA